MSFTNMSNIKVNNEKSMIILFNLNNKETTSIKNICRVIGVKEIVLLSSENANTKVVDILDNNMLSDNDDDIKEKVILFNNISPKSMNFILDTLRKIKAQNIYKATITPTSINWDIKTIIQNLLEEKIALKSNKFKTHK